jgi:hypothetical protein
MRPRKRRLNLLVEALKGCILVLDRLRVEIDRDMIEAAAKALEREVLDRPRDGDLVELYQLWLTKRCGRLMPSRSDFDPSEFCKLLPTIQLYDVGPVEGMYKVRLVGGALVELAGRNNTGKPPGYGLPDDDARSIVEILNLVVRRRAPLFGRGRVHWITGKAYRKYEGCVLPLSDDGASVNMILCALKFDRPAT